ncbi:MAG: hypothetical protein AAFZ15_26045 [Bacteroidota bacterium]
MKTLLIAFLTFSATFLFAQNNVTWIGGTPGNETAWDEAKNWSNHRVPDVFSNVVIPDVSSTTFSFPVIESDLVEINSIFIYSTAQLTIEEKAKLVIYGESENLINIVQVSSNAIALENVVNNRMACSKK